jgi:hypothetical protein
VVCGARGLGSADSVVLAAAEEIGLVGRCEFDGKLGVHERLLDWLGFTLNAE